MNDLSNLVIKEISSAETRNLRQLTLRQHQPADELVYPGDDDETTVHFGAYLSNELVGIASLYKDKMKGNDEPDSWRLRGMATADNARGIGIGKILMEKCLDHAKHRNGKLFWCNARTSAEGFYEKFGMNRIGEIFYPENLGPHVIMKREI